MVDAVVFDIGNVLLRFDFGVALRRILPHCSVGLDSVAERLDPLKIELETGRMGGEVFLAELTQSLGYTGDPLLLKNAWEEIFSPIQATHDLVERWSQTHPLFLLSNTNDLHAQYFLKKYDVFNRFKDRVFSHEVGVMKPDSGIYTRAVDQFGLRSERTLFIDDLEPNIVAAAKAGWIVHHYNELEHEALLSKARELGLLGL